MSGYRQRWIPPPTIDDYLYEIQMDIWWGHKDRAIRGIIWLMERYHEENENGRQEEGVHSAEEGQGYEREDGVECH